MNSRRATVILVALTLAICGAFLFVRLGHYALWDDEALTALNAEGILQTGDTTAVQGKNIVAYQGGILLKNLHDRSTPPLPSYVVAPFLWIGGRSAFAARLPFALMGFACAALMLWWVNRERASLLAQVMFCFALVANVSFFLYFRNCRYYAPAIFLSVAIAYVYLSRGTRPRWMFLISVLSILLVASNLMNFIALYACMVIDYLVWSRHDRRITLRGWLALVLPLVICGGAIVAVWNPLLTGNAQSLFSTSLTSRIITFFRTFRDLNACEYAPLILLLAAPACYFIGRNVWLIRASLALLVYIVVMAIIAPTPIARTEYSDVRYLAPIIPLCIAITSMVVVAISQRWRWLGYAIAALGFGTNILHFGPLRTVGFRSTIVSYIGELAHPPTDPYTVALEWMRAKIPPGSSILVDPNHATYPLMFHAPQYLYAWQLNNPPAPQFKNLPDIHFRNRIAPDYAIVFGPNVTTFLNRSTFEPIARLGHYWQDRHRPEIMFHSFVPITRYDPARQDIYVFRKRP